MENINNTDSNAESAESHLDKGNTLYDQGDYESAISEYDKALNLNRNLADAYFKRGAAKDEIGQYFEAISDYTEAIRLNPDDAKAYNNRGVSKSNLGHPAAVPDYDAAIRYPNDARVYFDEGSDNILKLRLLSG